MVVAGVMMMMMMMGDEEQVVDGVFQLLSSAAPLQLWRIVACLFA
jgi:hypothetical protein